MTAVSTPGDAPPAVDTTINPWRGGALVAVAVTVLLWASAFIGIRYAAEHLSPGPLALLRLAIGTVALGAMALVRRDRMPRGRDWGLIAIIGVLWFGVYNVALNAGEQIIDAGTASMLINTSPILIAILAGIFLREGFPLPLVIGIAIAFAGSVVVGMTSEGDEGAGAPIIGVLLCLLAAVVYAVSVVIQKGVVQRVSAIQVTFWACAIGMVSTTPWTGQLISELSVAPAAVTWTVVYLGIFPTAIAFTTWAYALRTLPVGPLGATTYVVPALVIGMSWLILAEVPTWGAVIGGVMCLIGVAVARRR